MITPYYYAAQTLLECSEGTTKLNERATLLPVPEQGAEQRCSGGGSWASRSRGKRAVLSARQKRTSREPRERAVRQARRRGKRRAAGRRELRGGRLLVGCDLREIAGGAEVTPPEVGRAASAQLSQFGFPVIQRVRHVVGNTPHVAEVSADRGWLEAAKA